jgi:serine protease Do
MSRKFLSTLLWIGTTLVAMPSLAHAQAQSTAVYIVNRSEETIENIFLSPVGNEEWGDDRLGDKTLLKGGRIAFNPGMAKGCSYDVLVVYADKHPEQRRNQNLCQLEEIVFEGISESAIDIVNASSLMIHYLHISPAGARNWGRDWLGADTGLAPGTRATVDPGRGGGCQYDLRVIYENRQEEEKRNQDLCSVIEVVFGGNAGSGGTADPRPAAPSFGTGFFFNADGYALTNHHVIDGCRTISMLTDRGPMAARVVRYDPINDLALLRVEGGAKAFATFRASSDMRAGDSVVVAGFPLPTVLQNGLNVTVGNISSLSGFGGNSALLQITAPVQPGNSGGPVLDMSGNVIGVIVSKLNAVEMAKATGDIPQNINFAVQEDIARVFLKAFEDVKLTEKPSGSTLAVSDVVANARAYTFQVECRP